jgi:alpha-N-arabinofuranosidase
MRIASGANAGGVDWTETLMAQAGDMMDAISLHFYTVPSGEWEHKGSATRFGEAEWIATLKPYRIISL